MALEDITAGNTIANLVLTNPADGDDASQGDDHIRNLKKSLQYTFPNISATASGVAAEFAFAHKGGTVSGNAVILGSLSVSGAMSVATTLSVSGAAVMKTTLTVEGATTLSGTTVVKNTLTVESVFTISANTASNVKPSVKVHGSINTNYTLSLELAEMHTIEFSGIAATLTIASGLTNDKGVVVIKNNANAITLAGIDANSPTLTNAALKQDIIGLTKSFGKMICVAAVLNESTT